MLESKNVKNNISFIKDLTKEELFVFAKEYLKDHVYISNKNLSSTYIEDHYDLGYRDISHKRIRRTLNSRFSQTIQRLHREGLISRYNNNGAWKRVELSKTDNETKLVYYEGRFVNPKFYDIK